MQISCPFILLLSPMSDIKNVTTDVTLKKQWSNVASDLVVEKIRRTRSWLHVNNFTIVYYKL